MANSYKCSNGTRHPSHLRTILVLWKCGAQKITNLQPVFCSSSMQRHLCELHLKGTILLFYFEFELFFSLLLKQTALIQSILIEPSRIGPSCEQREPDITETEPRRTLIIPSSNYHISHGTYHVLEGKTCPI